MTLDDVIGSINQLNKEGIEAKDNKDYDLAIEKHKKAVSLAEEAGANINPDYYAFSIANLAYAQRWKYGGRENVFNLLNGALAETKKAFESRTGQTYFGRSRLLEEICIVIYYNPLEQNPVDDLKDGLEKIEESMNLYESAFSNAGSEIVDAKVITNHLFRSIGVASRVALELALRSKGSDKKTYFEKALKYAQSELDLRVKNHETSGFGLMNAYHTLGEAQSELANDRNMYHKAKENLERATRLATDPVVLSVLNFRFAWLEYKANPRDKETIGKYFTAVLIDQDNSSARWPENVKSYARAMIHTLGDHLGGEYLTRVDKMYSSV